MEFSKSQTSAGGRCSRAARARYALPRRSAYVTAGELLELALAVALFWVCYWVGAWVVTGLSFGWENAYTSWDAQAVLAWLGAM